MKLLKIAALLAILAAPAKAGPYYGLSLSTTTGIAIENLSGYLRIAANQSSSNTNTIVLDGLSGSVRASTAALTGVNSSGVSLTAAGQLSAASLSNGTFISTANFAGAFNGASQLVQLNGSTQLPAVSGVLLTNLTAGNLVGGVPASSVDLSTVTTALALKANLAGATFTGAVGITNQALTLTGTAGVIVSGSSITGSHFGEASNLTNLTAANVANGTLNNGVKISTANIGPAFNAASELVQLNGSTQLPAVSGVLLTNLTAGNLVGGVPASSVDLSTITTALALKANLAGATFTGAVGLTNVSLTATGGSGNIISASSITTTGGVFGNGSGLTNVTATTNANMTGDVTSVGNATTAAATQANIKTLSGLTLISSVPTLTSTVTITANAFSVGSATFSISAGEVSFGQNYDVSIGTQDANTGSVFSISQSSGMSQQLTLTGNTAFDFTNFTRIAGQTETCVDVLLRQDSTGNRVPTMSQCTTWIPGGSFPTLATSAGKFSIVNICYDGKKYMCYFGGNSQ